MSKENKELKVVEVEVLTSKKGNKYLKGFFEPLGMSLIINIVSKETNKRIPLDSLSGKFKVTYSGYVLDETLKFLTLFKVQIKE